MKAITISRQMGSQGNDIAALVGKALGYQVYCREMINQAELRARTPEVALATIDELDLLGLRPSLREVRAYHVAIRDLMHELAQQGNVVLVGRAGQAILHGAAGVLHVRLHAPVELRVKRVAARHNISLEAARTQVTTSDQTRLRYVRRYYHVRWDDPDLYDLILNTANFSTQAAAAVICEAVKNSSAVASLSSIE